jgi:lipopolysaccharide transport system ATP-binding protein
VTNHAIRVDGLGKRYRLGRPQERYTTIRDQVRRLLSLRAFRADRRAEDADRQFWALQDVTFDVEPGEVVGIVGRNGAGKSTLLKILSRITEPTAGVADIYGRVGSLLEVGTGFHPELTGRENVFLNGAILGMRRAEIVRKFDDIIGFAEVEKFVDTPVKHYSSGMYTRLAFAVAAHLEPEIMIVDEVLAVGDMEFQKKCLGKMGEVARCGRTVLFVSHNLAAVRQLCNRGLLLHGGQLAFNGGVAECLDRYRSLADVGTNCILDHLSFSHEAIKVDEVTANGSTSDELDISSDERAITIGIKGSVQQPIRFDIEVRLHDCFETPVGFFSPAYQRGTTALFEPGPFAVERVMELPRMNQGTFYLNIFLAEPNVGQWVNILNGVRLKCEGTTTATGQVFPGHLGAGWFFLEEKTGG